MKRALIAVVLLLTPLIALAQVEEPVVPAEPLAPMAEGGGVMPPQVSFTGGLEVGGTIDAQAGIRFPDGTVQLSAAGTSTDLTANAGLYNNRIVEFSPALPYVEVCFKNGDFDFDIHVNGGDTTAGGDCVPGDVGWVIEREERVAAFWEDARAECLIDGMRLPEPFEYMFSCRRDAQLGLLEMTGNHEWASNEAVPLVSSTAGPVAVSIGESSCNTGTIDWIARTSGAVSSQPYRCVR